MNISIRATQENESLELCDIQKAAFLPLYEKYHDGGNPYLRGVERSEWLKRHTFYKHIGIYAFRADVLGAVARLQQTQLEKAELLEQLRWLESGYKIGVGVTDIETIGIDTPEDLQKAEDLLKI